MGPAVNHPMRADVGRLSWLQCAYVEIDGQVPAELCLSSLQLLQKKSDVFQVLMGDVTSY